MTVTFNRPTAGARREKIAGPSRKEASAGNSSPVKTLAAGV